MADETPTDYPGRLRAALAVMQKQQATIARLESAQSEPIAIIGIGCRFPGGANDPESFWRLLRDGVDAIREVPADRWPIDEYFDPNPDAPGKMATRWGGFLEDVDRFDARFFRISPREAIAMDPQQRLLLEVSWAALEHAAIDPSGLAGTQTGVFVGLTTLDYAKVIYRDDVARLDAYCATGNVANVASGRLSYFYGFRGPSLTVDTACSSSLVAVHLACQSLRSGESEMALAAGVNLILAPDGSIAVSRAHMLSPDGRCKTFDRSADGYARSEGCGVVVLKRWSKAVADRDRILALIRGSAVRQDGARSGLTVPNGPAQEAVIHAALQAARVKPPEVAYIEAHGTGTSLGDPIEVEALGNVFKQGRPPTHALVIGALKTNVGHMESAAGVGGIIKTVLALQHGEIPRHLHLRAIHGDIALHEIPAVVPTRHLTWPSGYERRIAGVSSFGSSGTVAHVVLEAAPDRATDDGARREDGRLPWLLPLSAATPHALSRMRKRYEAYLDTSGEAFGDICHTAAGGRAHLACRLAIVAANRDEALDRLRVRASEPGSPTPGVTHHKAVFVCSGEGTLYAGAGAGLYDTVPAFRSAIESCERLLADQLPAPLRDLFSEVEKLEETGVAHSAVFALEYAVACAWRAWGIEPAMVAGQGLGAYVAACVAGVFSLEDALHLVHARATLMRGSTTSRLPDSSLPAFRAAFESATFHAPRMRLVVNVSGDQTGANIATPAYWLSLERQPGPFAELMAALAAGAASDAGSAAPCALIEIGPPQSLLALAAATWAGQALWLPSLTSTRDEFRQMLDSAARLYEAGHDLHWPALAEGRAASRVSAPTYAFERERYWPDRPAKVTSPAVPDLAVDRQRPPPSTRPAAIATDRPPNDRTLRFGVMFFNGSEAATQSDNYRLVLEAARFADAEGLSSVWIPERHFTKFGSLYPNPATLHAAIARETSRVRLMAGSVVMPLHNPLRLTEEWSVVDNLSNGRVGMSFASGWNPDDFALNPHGYGDRHEALFRGIEEVRRLWRGETIEVKSGTGEAVRVRTYPAPVQRELPLWVTAASSPRTFERAGAIGANLLTHLLDHDVDELAAKVSAYRRERAAHGHDPDAGRVTVMLHTFLGSDIASVHAIAREPYCRYLKENIHLLKGLAVHRGSQVDVTRLSSADLDGFVGFLYDRFFSTRALLGTVDSCAPLVERLGAIGIDEIACLLDFGAPAEDVLASLPYLRDLAGRAGRSEPARTPLRSRGASTPVEARELLDHAYEIRWSAADAASQSSRANRRTIVVGDTGGVGAALVSELNAAGLPSTLADAETIASSSLSGADDIVYLKHLDEGPDADPTSGLSHAVGFVQAMARARTAAKLWFVTRGSQRARPGDRPSAAHAALWAMVKVLPIEMPRQWGGLIDVESGTPATAAARHLAAALTADAGEDQLAIRDGRLHVARLTRIDVPRSAPWSLRANATYLVTGGLRGLGLEAARWLARRGARHVVLIGRTPAAERRTFEVLRELERDGVDTRTATVDVANREALGRFAHSERDSGRPPIRGVVHAAGVWSDRALVDLTREELALVLAPKVGGTLALAEVFPSLDLFIGFSAFSALLPAGTQGNYAAANAFLDAFLRSHGDGRPGWTSVNWGPWADVGFATTAYGARAHARLESLGIARIAPRDGFATLDALVHGPQDGLGIMPVDWRRLFERDPNARLSPLLSDLYRQFGAEDTGGAGRVRDLLAGLAGSEEISCLERELTTMAAAILRLPSHEIGRLTSFTDLGVDSLMAVELKNRIQHETGIDLPLVKLLEGPSIADLAVLLAAHIKLTGLRTGVPAGDDLTEIEI